MFITAKQQPLAPISDVPVLTRHTGIPWHRFIVNAQPSLSLILAHQHTLILLEILRASQTHFYDKNTGFDFCRANIPLVTVNL